MRERFRVSSVAAIIAIALATVPLAYLVIRASSGGLESAVELLRRPRTAMLLLDSVRLAGAVTLSCLLLGTSLAWLVTRTDIVGRRIWQVACGLPLALPSYVAAWSWIAVAPQLNGFVGAWLVLTTISYPYVYLPALAALRRTDPDAEAVARTLGHGPWSAFFRVVLPQLRPALVGGALLVGLYVLSDFGAVATMRFEVLTTSIFRSYRSSFDMTPAAVLACVLAALALLIVGLEQLTRRRNSLAARPPRRQPVIALGRARWPAVLFPAAILALSVGVPLIGMIEWARRGEGGLVPGAVLIAALNTLGVAALAALGVVCLALPVAILAVRRPSGLSRGAEFAAYAGHALPGVVVGLGVVFFGIRFAQPLYQQVPMLVMAYVILFLALGLGVTQAAVAQVPERLEEVARTLGRTQLRATVGITARIAAPGAAMAAVLVFLTTMKELPATLMLRPTGMETLATSLWSRISSTSYAEAAPYAVAVVVLAAAPAAALAQFGERREHT